MLGNNLNWWIGVVEDRDDPEKMGRLRVRIIGAHSDDKTILPTDKLPWAITMQPTTSAAMSGIGTAPVGILPGTWCVGFFIDGDDMQQPMVMGTFGAKPDCYKTTSQVQIDANPPNTLRDSSGNPVYDGSGNPVQVTPSETPPANAENASTAVASDLPPLTKDEIQLLMDALGYKESSSVPGGVQNYTARNKLGYVGKYQFGAPALVTLGYVKAPIGTKLTNSALTDASNWVGKDGLNSLEDYYRNANVQESIMFQNLKYNYKILQKKGAIDANSDKQKVAGLLAVAHLLGAGGANQFAKGTDTKDGNGVTGRTYYNLGANAVVGSASQATNTPPAPNQEDPIIPPGRNPAGPLNDPSLGQSAAFADPEKRYPKCDYEGYPDTNKLAIGTTEGTQIEKRTVTRRESIDTVLDYWDEPYPAYCAAYPKNQTFETEAGHLVEFDNTPGSERIHVYHKSGTFIEVDVNGTMLRKSMGDSYEIIEHNNYVYVRGAYNMTVDGATQILVKNKCDIQIYGETNATFNNVVNMNVADDFNIIVGQNLNIKAQNVNIDAVENINFYNGGDVNMTSGGLLNIYNGSTYIDGGDVHLNSDLAWPIDSNGLGDPPGELNPENSDPAPLQRPDCAPDAYKYDAGEPGSEVLAQEQRDAGVTGNEVPKESGESTAPTSTATTVASDCAEFASFNEFPSTIKLSKYFTLGAMSDQAVVVKDKVSPQRGLTKPQIVCNLKNLAVNCLDKIKEKYPDVFITNAFRLDGAGRSATSDHGTGMAADLQFKGIMPSDYYDIVQWIAANVPYKQLLLEYGGGARNPWIHIAFDVNGTKSALPYATFKDHKVYAANKFVNLA